MGFNERWFENTTWFNESMGLEANINRYGLYVTCMVMFDLRRIETKPFLDCWWRENILLSTQDQVSFPYCAWKHNVSVTGLPDSEAPVRGTFLYFFFRSQAPFAGQVHLCWPGPPLCWPPPSWLLLAARPTFTLIVMEWTGNDWQA